MATATRIEKRRHLVSTEIQVTKATVSDHVNKLCMHRGQQLVMTSTGYVCMHKQEHLYTYKSQAFVMEKISRVQGCPIREAYLKHGQTIKNKTTKKLVQYHLK